MFNTSKYILKVGILVLVFKQEFKRTFVLVFDVIWLKISTKTLFVLTNGAIRVLKPAFPRSRFPFRALYHAAFKPHSEASRSTAAAFSSLGLKNDAFIGFALDYFLLVY